LTVLLVLVPYPLCFAFIGWLVFRKSRLRAVLIVFAWLIAAYRYSQLRYP